MTQVIWAQLSKMNALKCGGSCTGRLAENSALCSHRFARRASVAVLDTLPRVGVAPTQALLTPWGNASSLSGGRILKCFPRLIARSVAGPTLKNEPAEVRDSCTGWREQNSALWFPSIRTQGIGLCTRYTATVAVASPQAVLTPWGNASSLSGGRILKCFGAFMSASVPRHAERLALVVVGGHGFTPKVIWAIVKVNVRSCGLPTVAPHGFAEDPCTTLPSGRRRTGADSVSAGSRLHPDDGAIPRVQVAFPECG